MLTDHIRNARRLTATRANRDRQQRAELRLDEIVKVAGIADTYALVDSAGDLEMETWFGRAYQSAPDEAWRTTIIQGFAIWQRTEQREEFAVTSEVGDSVSLLKLHNPTFIDGQYVPIGSDGGA